MIVNMLNHSNTQKKYSPNFCQITTTSYLKRGIFDDAEDMNDVNVHVDGLDGVGNKYSVNRK